MTAPDHEQAERDRLEIAYTAAVNQRNHYRDRCEALADQLAEAQEQVNTYRIEADCAMRDFDRLELALGMIRDGRPNHRFDPWAREIARKAIEGEPFANPETQPDSGETR